MSTKRQSAGRPKSRRAQSGGKAPASDQQKNKPGERAKASRTQGVRSKAKPSASTQAWLYGRHAVAAALANPARKVRHVLATKNAAEWLRNANVSIPTLSWQEVRPEDIDHILHDGAVHQGLAAEVDPLPKIQLENACAPAEAGRPILILDQITDPQNIGALFRSAAAFGARAVIVQDRRTPPLTGALAKAAAGAIELLPCVEVVNIARAMNELQELGYFCAGLAGEAEEDITALPGAQPLALVMGAEGAGLRRLVSQTCDGLFRIPMAPGVESLNVSNAAAISLYEIHRRAK